MSDTDAEPRPAERPWPRVSRLRIAAPVVLIVAALVAAGITATMNENGTNSTTTTTTSAGSAAPSARPSVPLTYAGAAKLGQTGAYDWGAGCDHRTGRLKMPTVYSPPCVPAATGTNGGATSSGVTGDTINVVYYQAQPGGLASTISGAAGTNAQALATAQAYVAMFNQVYELYGRHVNLIPFTASGADADPVVAHADAVTVAQQLHAFASINGPGETSAYEEELAREHVLCMACGDSSTYGEIERNAPYQWANLPTADTSLNETVDYLVAKLNGKDAIWAGDPALHTQKRKFIVVSETSEPPAPGYARLTAELTRKLRGGPRQHGDAHRPHLHAQPHHAAHPGRHSGREAEVLGRHERRVRRRPDHADLPDQGVRQHRVLPRVDHHRHRADRHVDAGPLLQPAGVGARLRCHQPGRAGPRGQRRRRPSLPLVVRRHRVTGLPGGPGHHPAHLAVLRRRPAGRARPHARQLHHRPVPRPTGRAAGRRHRASPTATRAPRRCRATRRRPTTRSSGTTRRRRGPTRRGRTAAD